MDKREQELLQAGRDVMDIVVRLQASGIEMRAVDLPRVLLWPLARMEAEAGMSRDDRSRIFQAFRITLDRLESGEWRKETPCH